MTETERAQVIETVMSLHDLINELPEGVTLATVQVLTFNDAGARATLGALHAAASGVADATAALLKKIGG